MIWDAMLLKRRHCNVVIYVKYTANDNMSSAEYICDVSGKIIY